MSWRISNETVYPKGDNPLGNKFYGYRSTELVLPDGRPATYHGVIVSPCVHIVTFDNEGKTHLVQQSRPNARRLGPTVIPTTLELAGGFANPDDIEGSAHQELAEELGLKAESLEWIGQLYPSAGVSNETDNIYLATDLTQQEEQLGSGEATEQDMRIVHEPFGKLYREVIDQASWGNPASAQTLAAMAMVAVRL
jgi:8-oxo-dGTP pyrophosphatase MutT (NUDIX family)